MLGVGDHEAKETTPVGKQVEQAQPHLSWEKAESSHASWQAVDDVGNEGGKMEPQLLQHTNHHALRLTLQVAPGCAWGGWWMVCVGICISVTAYCTV